MGIMCYACPPCLFLVALTWLGLDWLFFCFAFDLLFKHVSLYPFFVLLDVPQSRLVVCTEQHRDAVGTGHVRKRVEERKEE